MTGGIDTLRGLVSCEVIGPSDAGYDEARATFNATIDRRPAVIARPRNTADVVAAVRWARETGLPICVRGGGHSVAGHAVGEGALVIDLRLMRHVDVDAAARRARVGGGALWEDVDRATTGQGLATPGGTFGDTGVGGLTLGGGLGFLLGTAGLTCDNLVRAEVVTADGSVVVAGEAGDPDLLWALRGGGGNFGAVTEFEFRLHPVGTLYAGDLSVPLASAGLALEAARELALDCPPELAIFAGGPSIRSEGGEAGPVAPGSAEFAMTLVYQGTPEAAELVLRPLRALPIVHDSLAPRTYLEVQEMNGTLPFGLSDEPEGGAAFGQREARWNVTGLGIWEAEDENDVHIGWARGLADGLRGASLSGAGYANYSSFDETAERVRSAFGDERFARLAAIKRRYDPDNVFRFNLNVPPAALT